jgi:hypothetical protein
MVSGFQLLNPDGFHLGKRSRASAWRIASGRPAAERAWSGSAVKAARAGSLRRGSDPGAVIPAWIRPGG